MSDTHEDQKRAGMILALREAGIGRAYADKSLEALGPQGVELRSYLIDNREAFMVGLGMDIRGAGVRASDFVNLFGRSLVVMGFGVKSMGIVTFANHVADEDRRADLMNCRCLIIRQFEGQSDFPLTDREKYLIENFIEERISEHKSITIARASHEVRGWWSYDTEDALATANTTLKV